MANGSMSTTSKSEQAIRQRLIESDHIDCMVALPGNSSTPPKSPPACGFSPKTKAANTAIATVAEKPSS